MKIQFMVLTGLLVFSTNTFAASKNKCDQYIAAGMPQSVIEKCWEQYGKSAHYLEGVANDRREYEESLAAAQLEQQQIEAEKRRIQILSQALVEKRFTYLDLKEKGFGLPFVAIQRTFIYKSNGQFKKTEDKTLTSGTNICQFLGYDKAKNVEINNKEIDAHKAKGKAFYIKKNSPLFSGSTTYDETPFVETSPDVVVLYMRAVTCVRSKIANNELLTSIQETTRFLEADINTGAPIIQENVAINTTSRNHVEEEEDEQDNDNSDDSPFTHTTGQ